MTQNRTVALIALGTLLAATLACTLPIRTPRETGPTITPYQPESTVVVGGGATPKPTVEPTAAPGQVLRVVYASDGRLWIVEGDEPGRQLTSGPGDSTPVISPDSQWVVFRHEVAPSPWNLPRFELRVIAADGSGEHTLVEPQDIPGDMGTPIESDTEVLLDRLPLQVEWLPDSHTIAFNTRLEFGYGLISYDDLWLVDRDTETLTQLLHGGEGGVFAFSPDGRYLAVGATTSVSLMRADGTGRRTMVTFDRVNTASEYAYHPQPTWAPDGSYALIAISSPDPFGPDPAATIWRLPLVGGGVRLGTLHGEFLFTSMSNEIWSADRTQLAYTVPVERESNTRDLVIADVDGSHAATYATGDMGVLAWAAEGDRFAFWQDSRSEIVVGQVGQAPAPISMPDSGPTHRVVTVRWIGADTLVYGVTNGESSSIWRQTVGSDAVRLAEGSGSYPDIDVSW